MLLLPRKSLAQTFGRTRAFQGAANKPAAAGGGGVTYLINEGFESGSQPAGWSSNNSMNVPPDWGNTTSPSPLAGSKSLYLTGGDSEALVSFTAGSPMELYCLFRLDTLNSGTTFPFGFVTSGAANNLAFIGVTTSGTLSIYFNSVHTGESVGTIAVNTTYHLWLRYVKGTGANAFASVEFSTNGTRSGSGNNYLSASNGDSTADAGFVNFSCYNNGQQWIDHVLIAVNQTIPSNP